MDPSEMDVTKNPEYRTSVAKVDEAIREHHQLLQRIGNEHDGGTESAFVFGWVLGIGITGIDDDGDEFTDLLVDYSSQLNDFTKQGMTDQMHRFVVAQNDNYSGRVEL